MSPRVIGIDPSMTATGIAYADGSTRVIRTDPKAGDDRLADIDNQVRSAICDEIDLAVVEDLPRNAMGAGITGLAHGVIRLALLREGVPYIRVPAATLKVYATGKGTATKPDMRLELFKRTNLDVRDDNEVDAAWLRLLGLDLAGRPEINLPQTHRRALDKLTLPAAYNGPAPVDDDEWVPCGCIPVRKAEPKYGHEGEWSEGPDDEPEVPVCVCDAPDIECEVHP